MLWYWKQWTLCSEVSLECCKFNDITSVVKVIRECSILRRAVSRFHIYLEEVNMNAWRIYCASEVTVAQILPLAQYVNNV
jgi:hypothetical protein